VRAIPPQDPRQEYFHASFDDQPKLPPPAVMQVESPLGLTMSALDRIKEQLAILDPLRMGLDFLFQRHYQRLLYKQGGRAAIARSKPSLLFCTPDE
jgi:hypothetical protein